MAGAKFISLLAWMRTAGRSLSAAIRFARMIVHLHCHQPKDLPATVTIHRNTPRLTTVRLWLRPMAAAAMAPTHSAGVRHGMKMGTGYFRRMIMTKIRFGRSVYNITRIFFGQTHGIRLTHPAHTTGDITAGPRFQLGQSRPPIIQPHQKTDFRGRTIQAGP